MTSFYEIPTSQQSPHYQQDVLLSGVTYQLSLRFNTRMDQWMLDVAAADGTPIVSGVAMLVGRDLVGQYAALPLPPGTLFCHNPAFPLGEVEPSIASFQLGTMFLYADYSA